jgi:hypothetical protein
MPVGERAIQRVTWNHFFARPAFAQRPVTALLFWSRCSGCVSARRPPSLIVHRGIGFDCRRRLSAILVTPGELFLTLFEAGEVTAAGDAAVRSGAQPQLQQSPAGRAVVLFAPGGKLLAIALRAARVFPGGGFPSTGGPAGIAAAAAQGANPNQALEPFGYASAMGHTGIT